MTDAHVHFRDWNQKNKETVLHGMLTGAKAGFNVFFDMPNTNPPVTSRDAALKRLELGSDAESELRKAGHDVHYHIYLGLTQDKDQISEIVRTHNELFPKVCGLKMFASQSTGNMGIIGKDNQAGIYRTLAELDYRGVLAVHCEKEELFKPDETTHSAKRPAESEEASVRDQIENAEKSGFKGTLHIAHISTEGALKAVRQARECGRIRVTCGATPHHILLNSDSESDIVKMNPPLRPESDRIAVWNALFDGTINWVESDHAPHTLEDKRNGASGIPGFEGMLLTVEALRKAGMSEARLTELFCTNALKAFGIDENSSPVPEVTQEMLDLARRAYPFSAWKE
ncbi:MAG: amidohydrolase family protein [Spirochaetales bacterium]|nr:amidohydrolase family protein [Spirochaetales bacterium]